MYYLIFYDFKEDVKKVSLARLLKSERNLSLRSAKNAVDTLIEGTPVIFPFTDKNLLEQLKKEATSMGVKSRTANSIFIPNTVRGRRGRTKPESSKPQSIIPHKKEKEFLEAVVY